MPIVIRSIDRQLYELDSVAFGAIHYLNVEKHLIDERMVGGLAYKEFIDARDAGLAFALNPTEVRQVIALVRSLGQQARFGPTAVLVSTDIAFGIMRAMEALLEDVADVRPFRQERLARSWLAAKPLKP